MIQHRPRLKHLFHCPFCPLEKSFSFVFSESCLPPQILSPQQMSWWSKGFTLVISKNVTCLKSASVRSHSHQNITDYVLQINFLLPHWLSFIIKICLCAEFLHHTVKKATVLYAPSPWWSCWATVTMHKNCLNFSVSA